MFTESLESTTSLHSTISSTNNVTNPKVMNTVEDDEQKSCCTIKNVVGPVFKILNALGACGTAAATVVTLIYFVIETCDSCAQSIGPAVAAVVAAVATAVFALLNESWDIFITYDDKKETDKKEKLRDEHVDKRFDDLTRLLMQAVTSVEDYEKDPIPEKLKKCARSVQKLPKDSNFTREVLMTRALESSPLKANLDSIKEIGLKIDNSKPDYNGEIKKPGNNGESQAPNMGAANDMSVIMDLENFQKDWKAIEDAIGYSPDALLMNGIFRDKYGNQVGSSIDNLSLRLDNTQEI